MAKNKPTLFADVVGQSSAKKRFSKYQECYYKRGRMPNTLIVAAAGGGKTFMATELSKHLIKKGEPKAKPFLELNCASFKNIRQFFNAVVIPHMVDKDLTILFDEASELPPDMQMSLLSMINPNPNHRNEFTLDDYTVEIDFYKHTFMFATSEPHKIFHALKNRLRRIDLEKYTNDEFGEIISRMLPDVKFDSDVLSDIVTCLRGNAREAQLMADEFEIMFGKSGRFDRKAWNEIKDLCEILPLGLYKGELEVLHALAEINGGKGCSLTALAAKTSKTPESVRQDLEHHLTKMGLMQVERSGRSITSEGRKYLEVLDAA